MFKQNETNIRLTSPIASCTLSLINVSTDFRFFEEFDNKELFCNKKYTKKKSELKM